MCLKVHGAEMTDSKAKGLACALCIHLVSLLCHPYLERGIDKGIDLGRKWMVKIYQMSTEIYEWRLILWSSYFKSILSLLFEAK